MREENLLMNETTKNESKMRTLKPKIESIEKLKKKIYEKDKRMKNFRKETRNLVSELDYAYKELRKTQEELIFKEKLAAVGGIAAGVAHEIRNSLNIIGMSVQYLQSKFSPEDEKREFTETILEKVDKLNSVATDLIHFARPHKPIFEKSDIHSMFDRVISLVKFRCIVQKIEVIKKLVKNMPLILIDRKLMEQVLSNLIDNSLWAMPKGGKLNIATHVPHENNFIEIKICDSGCGISNKDISRIFDPFFSRRENGTGLGLSIVHRIIEEHRGSIDVKSELGKGTAFSIRLPVSQKK